MKKRSSSTPARPRAESRPTLVPAFDVESYARMVGKENPRDEADTLTDEVETERARIRSAEESRPADVGSLDHRPRRLSQTLPIRADAVDALGSLAQVPRLAHPATQLSTLDLDPRSAFILALTDGVLDYETILDVCALPRVEAVQILADLLRKRIIVARLPR